MICCQAGWNRNSSLFRVWIDANSILGAAVAKPICVRINCVGYCYYKSFLNFVQQHKPAPSIRPEYLSSEKHLTSNFIFFEEPGWGPSFFVSCLYRMLTCRRRSSVRDMAHQPGPIRATCELVPRPFDQEKDVQFLHSPSQSTPDSWTLLTKYPQGIRSIVFAAQFSLLYREGANHIVIQHLSESSYCSMVFVRVCPSLR